MAAALAAAVVCIGAGAAPAAGSVTVGATSAEFADANIGYACRHPDCGMWQVTAPLGHTSTSPIDGIVVGWRMKIAGIVGSSLTVIPRLLGPVSGGPMLWGAAGPTVALPDSGYPRTIETPMRMPIARGQAIGVEIPQPAIDPENPSQLVGFAVIDGDEAGNCSLITPAPPPGGSGDGFECATEYNLLAIAADIEPDADGDGFGDETQDACPTDAASQSPCAVTPVTPVTLTGDQEGPALTWCGRERLRMGSSRVLRGCVGSNELAGIEVTASVELDGTSIDLGPVATSASPLAPASFGLKLTRRASRRLARALESGRSVAARFAVAGTDAAGNASAIEATAELRTRR